MYAAINSKSIYCSFCANVLLDHIGKMAKRYCIEIIVYHYIEKSIYSLEADEERLMLRPEYFLMLKGCKECSKIK